MVTGDTHARTHSRARAAVVRVKGGDTGRVDSTMVPDTHSQVLAVASFSLLLRCHLTWLLVTSNLLLPSAQVHDRGPALAFQRPTGLVSQARMSVMDGVGVPAPWDVVAVRKLMGPRTSLADPTADTLPWPVQRCLLFRVTWNEV